MRRSSGRSAASTGGTGGCRTTPNIKCGSRRRPTASRTSGTTSWGAHTYDTPEVIQLPITAGSAAYLAWLTDETKPRQKSRSSARSRADRPGDASSVSRSPIGFVG
ncbi:divalent cation tolerance protein CutA [Embleya sp. NPDC059237]|uniref:divalent cation tolerance protein CutA n=1 Tax=Embleya sp. NPDC059237 TaxID=3346784 RepID=UPI0036AA721C